MTWTLSSGRKLLSHPAENGHSEKPLWKHLSSVSKRGGRVIQGDLAAVERLLGLSHDFPKATPAFQRHVRDEHPDGPKHHARLAALVAYFFLDENDYCREIRLAGMLAVAKHHGSVPDVARYIRTVVDEPRRTGVEANLTNQALQQAAAIQTSAEPFTRHVFEQAVDEEAWPRFLDRIGEPGDSPLLDTIAEDAGEREAWGNTIEIDQRHFDASLYTTLLVLFGGLTLADKTDAAHIPDGDSRLQGDRPPKEKLTKHLRSLGGNEHDDIEGNLNTLRGAIQGDIPDRTEAFLDSDRAVATLTLPTGYGKTLAGLLAGLQISDQRGGRVVYALPFTSIIDQTAATLQDVFETDPTGNLLTVHHHLSETRTVDDERAAESETDEHAPHEVLLAEGWRTGLTLTTFVQLFESLAGPTNGQSLKLPSLQGSTVIIDEPQAIPQHWWPLIRQLIDFLTEELDARVLLMTATQPTLVEEENRFELLSQERLTELEEGAFDGASPSRVSYQFDQTALATDNDGRLPHDDAAQKVAETVIAGTDDSVLTICNTVTSTRTLTDAFTDTVAASEIEPLSIAAAYDEQLGNEVVGGLASTMEIDGETRPSIERARLVRRVVEAARDSETILYLHLTARIRPCDRQFLLAVAKDVARLDVPFAFISTQLVEAGVDISFDAVFRDFAPLDAIVQAAGRCNRSYEHTPETGTTTVWQLQPPEETGGKIPPSTAVYAPNRNRGETDLLQHTQQVLADIKSAHGKSVSDNVIAGAAVQEYHDIVGERVHSVSESDDLVAAFEQADGETLRRESIIEGDQSMEVYVCRTNSDRQAVKKLREYYRARKYDKLGKKRDELASIRVSLRLPRSETDAARGLQSLEPLIRRNDGGIDPERLLETSDSIFDPEFGVQPDAYGVEDRFK